MQFLIHCSLPNHPNETDVYTYDNMSNLVRDPEGKIIDFWKNDLLRNIHQRGSGPEKVFGKDDPIVGKHRRIGRLKIQLGTACNYHCKYCMQASYRSKGKYPSDVVIRDFIDKLTRNHIEVDSEFGAIQYWGGEPLVYWRALKTLIPLLREKYGESAHHSLVTNGSLLTKEKIDFLMKNRVQVVISHDGPGFCLRDDSDPLLDPEKKAVWLYLYEESRKHQLSMAFNVVLTPKNCDLMKIRGFFDTHFVKDIPFSIEGVVTAETDQENTAFSRENARELDASIFKAIVTQQGKWSTLDSHAKDLIARITHRIPVRELGVKCESASRRVLVTDLYGRVVSCQNRDADHYRIGTLDDLDHVMNDQLTHWAKRDKCKNCFVLQSCKGSCPHMNDAQHRHTCQNEFIYHAAIFSSVWFLLTGRIIRAVTPAPKQVQWDGWTGTDRDPTKLYLMLGAACNLKCRHCYQTEVPKPRLDKRIDERVYRYLEYVSSIHEHPIDLVFWGGEPLLYFRLIQDVVERIGDDKFNCWIMSNGVLLTDEIVDYLNQHHFGFSVSNDGPDTAKIRGINVLEDEAFCRRFKRIRKTCVGACTHAYNIDPYTTVEYIKNKLGEHTHVYYQYILECTFPMDDDLYAYDLAAYRRNMRRCADDYFRDRSLGQRETPAVYAMEKGIKAAENYRRRKAMGMPEQWYPECQPMRHEMNIDIHGVVHLCHNQNSPIGTVDDSFETLLARSNTAFRKAIEKKTECLSCDVNYLCRHGCPLNPMTDGQRACCEAERIYWSESARAVARHDVKPTIAIVPATIWSDDTAPKWGQ